MKVTLTTQEILAKFGLPADTELIIESGRDAQDADDGWISNIGYDEYWYPSENLDGSDIIKVKFRDGSMSTGFADSWDGGWNWRELDGKDTNIVAYRILNMR